MKNWLQEHWLPLTLTGFFLLIFCPFLTVGIIQAEKQNREACEKWQKAITQMTLQEAIPEDLGDNWYRFDTRPRLKQNWDIFCQTEVQVWPEIYKRFQRENSGKKIEIRNTMLNSRGETVFVQVEIMSR